jgi:hypothetical protein
MQMTCKAEGTSHPVADPCRICGWGRADYVGGCKPAPPPRFYGPWGQRRPDPPMPGSVSDHSRKNWCVYIHWQLAILASSQLCTLRFSAWILNKPSIGFDFYCGSSVSMAWWKLRTAVFPENFGQFRPVFRQILRLIETESNSAACNGYSCNCIFTEHNGVTIETLPIYISTSSELL